MRVEVLAEYEFFVGRKGVLAYVGAILAKIDPDNDSFFIKARGKAINKAVDIALITTAKMKGLKIDNVDCSSTTILNQKKEEIILSCIEIKIVGV